MLKSKQLSIVVLAVFFLSVFTGWGTQTASAASSPTDIAGNWASTQISFLISQGVVTGYADGTFKPNNSISRAEFITIINRALNLTVPASIYYSDVKTSEWYYLDICKAKAAGYISGYPDGTMKPKNNVSRQEAAVILAKALNMANSSTALTFSDTAKIPSWSLSAISSLVGAGYVSGYPDGTFRPASYISRAEAAAMIYACKSKWIDSGEVAVSGVSLNKSTLYLDVDEDYAMSATISPSDATNKDVVWSSSDEDVAEVDDEGTVTALGNGTCHIKVTNSDGSYYATCTVYVGYSSANRLTMSDDKIEMDTETSKTVRVYMPDGCDTGDVDNVDWVIDGDDEIIDQIDYVDVDVYDDYIKFTVDSSAEEGNCTINFAIAINDDTYEGQCEVTVPVASDLNMSDDKIEMETEASKIVKIYMPDDYDTGDVDNVDWDIDDDDEIIDKISYADLDVYDNYIKFTVDSSEEEGNCTINFEIEIDGDTYKGQCEVTVGDAYELSMDYDEIEIETEASKIVKVYMPDDYDTGDVDNVDWVIAGDDEIIDQIQYADVDNYDNYIKFLLDSSEEVGDCTITFEIKINGDIYKAECDATVN